MASTKTTTRNATELAETYFKAWSEKDWDTLRSILADDCTFHGPLATLDNADDCVEGLKGMSQIVTDIKVHRRIADDNGVITWFDLHTQVADPAPTANWSEVAGGRITAIRVAFDARAIAPPS